MNPTVVALARQPRRGPLAARGDRRACRARPCPVDARRRASTPAARTTAPTLLESPSATVRRACPAVDVVPRRRAARARAARRAGSRREWVWLLHDDANPAPDALGRAAGRGRGRPRGRRARPQAARVALAAAGCSRSASPSPAPAGARPGSSAASTTRASTTRSARCSRSTPPACWCAAACSTSSAASTTSSPIFGNDIDFGWRAAAAGHRTVVVPHGGGLPRRGRAPRRPAYAADRPPHPLPGAPGRAVHAAGQRPAPGSALAGRPALLRHAAADARLPAGPLGRARRSTSWPPWSRCTRSPGEIRGRPRGRRSRPPAHEHDVRGAAGARGGCPTGTASTSSATSRPPLTNQAQDVADRRRAAKEPRPRPAPAAPRRSIAPDDEDAVAEDTGLVARFLTNPLALALTVFVVLVARRRARGVRAGHRRRALARRRPTPATCGGCRSSRGTRSGTGHRGPCPAVRRCRWRCSATRPRRQRCRRGVGDAAARRTAGAVGRLAVPAGGGPPGRPGGLAALAGGRWARVTYALVPVVSGAWGDGRLGVVVVAALLPWLGARRARLRRPRARPPLARRLADRTAARAGCGVRRRSPGSSPCCWRWS